MRAMKDSGVEWIGEIPEGWNVVANKYLMHKEKVICPVYHGEPIISLTMDGVIERDLDAGGKMPSSFDGYQCIHAGNLLLCLFDIDVTPRCVGLSSLDGLTSPAYSQFIVDGDNDAKFYFYYYLAVDNDKVLVHLTKNMRYALNVDEFGAIKAPQPPLDEQRRIADYLDARCADIDAVSQKVRSEIDLLGECRKSVIYEAVTKGLDKGVPMRDSGIEWVGEMPEGWDTLKGKYVLTLLQRSVRPDDGVITCFRDGEVTLRSNRREDGFTMADREIGYQGINAGDLVIHGMDGFAGAIGISDSRGKGSPVLIVLDSEQNKRYLMYYIRCMAMCKVFEALSTGIRVRSCDLSWQKLANLPFPIPPLDEQRRIADYLDARCADIDAVIAKKRQQLDVLADYRKSLIYEYVTGKREVA